jgi:hypothetical protein
MKMLTRAQLFNPPKKARNIKTRLERAKLVIVRARERAALAAKRYAAQPSAMRPMRPPTELHRRRLAERLAPKFR